MYVCLHTAELFQVTSLEMCVKAQQMKARIHAPGSAQLHGARTAGHNKDRTETTPTRRSWCSIYTYLPSK